MTTHNGQDADALRAAAELLARGDLVAFPTETVYGLGARADQDEATAKIFAAKGRPSDHPLIVHVPDEASAQAFAAEWPESAQRLVQAFWPGPVTVIVPRQPGMATAAAGGQNSIGLRCPAHPVALALLREAAALGVAGVAAPSANGFGRISPTAARHVADEFGPKLFVLDGGDCAVGIESAIVDCTRSQPVLLRPGQISRVMLEQVLGQALAEKDQHSPRASGTLAAHYAPRAKVRLMTAAELQAAVQVLGATAQSAGKSPTPVAAVYSRSLAPQPGWPWRRMPADATEAAHELFAALRELDGSGAPLIWIETPPAEAAWEGVQDRLTRAAAA